MAPDPAEETRKYMERHRISTLFEAMTASLIFHRPVDPQAHLVKTLTEMKASGPESLLTTADLNTMFGMFDLTKRGVVTVQQAEEALKTILGPEATLGEATGETLPQERPLTKDEFTQHMTVGTSRSVFALAISVSSGLLVEEGPSMLIAHEKAQAVLWVNQFAREQWGTVWAVRRSSSPSLHTTVGAYLKLEPLSSFHIPDAVLMSTMEQLLAKQA